LIVLKISLVGLLINRLFPSHFKASILPFKNHLLSKRASAFRF
jgi:hypothetical protein